MPHLLLNLFCLITTSISQASPTHVVYLKDGTSVVGTPSPGRGPDQITIQLEDDSKVILNLDAVREVQKFNSQDITGSIVKDGPIPPPRNWRLGLQTGVQALGSSSYKSIQQGGATSTSSETSSHSLGFRLEGGYKKSTQRIGIFISFDVFPYAYQGTTPSDSQKSISLLPRYYYPISQKLNLSGGIGIGLTTLSLGQSTKSSSGATIALEDSKTAFSISPRIGAEYEWGDRLALAAELAYNSISTDFTGTVSSPGVSNPVNLSLSRNWLTISSGLVYRFSR